MVVQVLSRINDCALRENTVSSLQQTQKFLEQQINSKFSHVKLHMQSLDGKIAQTDKTLSGQIQDIKLKTLGKITGGLTRLRKPDEHQDLGNEAGRRAAESAAPNRRAGGEGPRGRARQSGGHREAAEDARERLPERSGDRAGWG